MWPALCPHAPTLTLPLPSASIALSLASRSCVAKPDHGYQKCTLVPPQRFHQCQPQSVPNPPHELDLEYTSGAWRCEIPRGHLVDPRFSITCVPTRWARLAFFVVCCWKTILKKRFGVAIYFCFISKGKNKIRKKNPKCDS